MKRFTITIEGPNWKDVGEVELPRLPSEGELIETKYGTCVVTRADTMPDSESYAGQIVCSFP